MNRVIPVAILLAGAVAAGWWYDVPSRLGWARQSEKQFTLYGNVDIRQVSLAFRVNGRLEEVVRRRRRCHKARRCPGQARRTSLTTTRSARRRPMSPRCVPRSTS